MVKRVYLLIRSQTGANGEKRTAIDRLENEGLYFECFCET